MSGSAASAELVDSSAQDGVIPQQAAQNVCEPAAEDVLAFLFALEERAKACGVGPSEWHYVRNRPLLDVLHYVESLETPSSVGASSSRGA